MKPLLQVAGWAHTAAAAVGAGVGAQYLPVAFTALPAAAMALELHAPPTTAVRCVPREAESDRERLRNTSAVP